MNQSMPDIKLAKKAWTEIYAATAGLGFPVALGTPLSLQNKTKAPIQIIERDTMPAQNTRDGLILLPMQKATVLPGSLGVWIISRQVDGAVFVQEVPR